MAIYRTDLHWVRRAFLLTNDQMNEDITAFRFFSSGELKYTDTLPGGNHGINPPPQFTLAADIPLGTRRLRMSNGLDNTFEEGAFGASSTPQRSMYVEQRPSGMGRMYSEGIDDHARIIYLQFGVASFTPMTRFFANFYDVEAAYMARTGRSLGAMYWIGRAVGYIVPLYSWQLMAISLISNAASLFTSIPSTKYMQVKETMGVHLHCVSTMMNNMAVYRKIIPKQIDLGVIKADQNEATEQLMRNQVSIDQIHKFLPGVFTEKGAFDAYRFISRATRLQNRYFDTMITLMKASPDGFTLDNDVSSNSGGYVPVDNFLSLMFEANDHRLSLDSMDAEKNDQFIYELSRTIETKDASGKVVDMREDDRSVIGRWVNSAAAAPKAHSAGALEQETIPARSEFISSDSSSEPIDPNAASYYGSDNSLPRGEDESVTTDNPTIDRESGHRMVSINRADMLGADEGLTFGDYYESKANEGMDFIGFYVDNVEPATWSVSNSTMPNPMEERLNSVSSSARTTSMSLSGFNFSDNFIVKGLTSLAGGVLNAASGMLNSLGLGGLAMLTGGGEVDIPHIWSKSEYTPGSMNYSIEIVPPYNNQLSTFLFEDLTICALACGALPLATGRHSHTSPFYCMVYDKSHAVARIGMIRNLSVERGIATVPFDKNHKAIGSRINFTIENLDPSMSVHISQGWSAGVKGTIAGGVMTAAKSFMDDFLSVGSMAKGLFGSFSPESPYLDLITTMAGVPIQDQIYWTNRFSLAFTAQMKEWEILTSKARLASILGDTWIGDISSAFAPGTARK